MEGSGPPRKDKDAFLATLYRIDPDRLRQLRRVMSGVTRCPECDHQNPAGRSTCAKCGARLYPVEEAEEWRVEKRGDEHDGEDS